MMGVLQAVRTAAQSVVAYVAHVLRYFKGRLFETSTWAAVVTGGMAAASLSPPWSYIVMMGSVMTAMVPKQGAAQ